MTSQTSNGQETDPFNLNNTLDDAETFDDQEPSDDQQSERNKERHQHNGYQVYSI